MKIKAKGKIDMRSLYMYYKNGLTIKRISVLFVGVFIFFQAALFAETLTKAPDDQSVSRHFVLENGLKVLVVSDPKFNNSAAALEVHS